MLPAIATPSESVFRNERGMAVGELVDAMRRKGKLFGNGYGDLKEGDVIEAFELKEEAATL